MSALGRIGDMTYGELLDALRKDLQLDVTTDVLSGTVAQAVVNDAGNATTATAGAAGALPAPPAGYLVLTDRAGTVRKVPYYNT